MWDHHQTEADRGTGTVSEETKLPQNALWKQSTAASAQNQRNRSRKRQSVVWNG